jgi:hypothetical protein
MRRLLLPLLLAFTACALASTAATAQAPMVTFPDVTGRNLEGRTLRLPADFEGDRSIVLVAFRQRQQREVDSWMPELNALRAADPDLAVYEIPTLSSGWTPLRGWIDGGMARGIKSQAVREVTVTLYINKGPFKDALAINSEATIHLLLLDREGRVTFRTTGPATPEGIAALRRALGVMQ